MFKILILTSILGLVVGDDYTDKLTEKMRGDWTPVKIFPARQPYWNSPCYPTINTISDDYCKCGGKTAPQLNRSNRLRRDEIPIIIVETEEELQKGYNTTCLCKERDETSEQFNEFVPSNHMMIRFINDNYFMAYDKDYRDRKPDAYNLLIARDVPTTAEVQQFVSTIDYIKNEKGLVIFTKDYQPKQKSDEPPFFIISCKFIFK